MKNLLRFIAPAFAMLALSSWAAQWQQYPTVSAPGLSDTFLIGTSTTNQQISAANYATWVLNRNTSGVLFTNTFAPGMQLIVVGTNANGQMIVRATNVISGGDMLRSQNLADVANAATARDNIGADNASNLTLGTLAQGLLPGMVVTNNGAFSAGLLKKGAGANETTNATPSVDYSIPSDVATAQAAALAAATAQQQASNNVYQIQITNKQDTLKFTIPLTYQTNINTGTAYSSWPQSALDTNGDFVVEFCIGNRHLLTNRAVYMVKSSDRGLSWTTPTQIYTNANTDIADGVAFGIHQRTGRYILAGATRTVTTGVQGATFIKYSDDHGSTWTDATSFQKFSGLYDNTNCPSGKVITCGKDRLLFGYYGNSNSFDQSIIFAMTSDDLGLTWQTNFIVNSAVSGFREANFTYLGNSNVLAIIRRDQAFQTTSNIFYQAHSIDNGTTWVLDGPVTLGYVTGNRQPAYLATYDSGQGRRVVMCMGNRENGKLELRDVSAWDTINNLTNVWLNAKVETLATICPLQGDGGYGSPVGYGNSGDFVIPYYFSTSNNLAAAYEADIRFATRSPNIQQVKTPTIVALDTGVSGLTNSVAETDMVNFTIPGGTLFGTHGYEIMLTGMSLNNAAAAVTNRVRVYFGSTVIYDQQIDATLYAIGSGIRPYRLNAFVGAMNSQTNQTLRGFWHLGSSTVPTVGAGNINATVYGGGVFGNRINLDARTNNVFRVTFTLTPASPSFWFDHDSVTVTYY